MLIPVRCKSCGFTFQVDAHFAGRQGRCPRPECRREFQIPLLRHRTALQQLSPAAEASLGEQTSVVETAPKKNETKLPAARSGLPQQIYFAGSFLAVTLLLLIAAVAILPGRLAETNAAETPDKSSAANKQASADEKSVK